MPRVYEQPAEIRELLGPLPFSAPDDMLRALRQAYAEPPRAYHTLEHAAEVLAEVRRHAWEHPVEAAVAALYHDAVYVVGAPDNEARSAMLAREAIARWGLPADPDRVERLILLTARHGRLDPTEVTEEEARFLDCDMAILAAPPEVYERYERAIAEEHAALPPEVYAAGRAAFLRSLLGRRIFLGRAHAALEPRARANLERALRS